MIRLIFFPRIPPLLVGACFPLFFHFAIDLMSSDEAKSIPSQAKQIHGGFGKDFFMISVGCIQRSPYQGDPASQLNKLAHDFGGYP